MSNLEDQHVKLANLRREYGQIGLRRAQLPDEPLDLFKTWLQDICDAAVADPTAMSLGTVDEYGQPWQRIVLLKEFDSSSMTFYTNLASRKAQHIKANPKVSMHFPWYALDRQVIASGLAHPLSRDKASQYFSQRPRESQISAWASPQSKVLACRSELEKRFIAMSEQFNGSEVSLPEFWGGFRVELSHIEFWQGGKHRLHDRFLYQKLATEWKISRLAP